MYQLNADASAQQQQQQQQHGHGQHPSQHLNFQPQLSSSTSSQGLHLATPQTHCSATYAPSNHVQQHLDDTQHHYQLHLDPYQQQQQHLFDTSN